MNYYSPISSLEQLIREEQMKIDGFYMQIGAMYYEQNKNVAYPAFTTQMAGIKASVLKIEEYNNQIAAIRNNAFGIQSGGTCRNCGGLLRKEDKFCARCGAKVSVDAPAGKVCKNCGNLLGVNDAFCMRCGTKVENVQPEPITYIPDEADACGTAPLFERMPGSPAFAEPAKVVFSAPAVSMQSAQVIEETEAETEITADEAAEDSAEESVVENVPEVPAAEEIVAVAEEIATEDVAEDTAEEPADEDAPEVPAADEVNQVVCDAPASEPAVVQPPEFSNPYEVMLSDIPCPACNKTISPTAKYCIYCGTKL